MGAVDLVIQVESPTVGRPRAPADRPGRPPGRTPASRGVIFPKYRGDLLEAAVVAERMHAGRDRDDDDPAQPARRARPADRGDDGHGPLDGRRPLATVTPGAARSRRSAARRSRASSAMLAGAYPSDEFAELKARDRLGPGDRASSRAGATPGSSRSRAAGRSRTAGCTASSSSASRDAGPAGRRARRGDGLREPGRRGRSRSARRAGGSRRSPTTGSSSRPAPGRAGQAAVLARRRRRPADRARAGARRVRAARSRPTSAAAPRPDRRAGPPRRAHDLDRARRPRTCVAYLEDERDVAGRAADRPADRRRALPRRARRLAAVPPDARSAAGSTRRGRSPSRRACASGSGPRSRRSGPTTGSPSGCRTRDLDGVDELLFPDPDEIEDLVVGKVADSALFAARFRENAARALLLPRRRPGHPDAALAAAPAGRRPARRGQPLRQLPDPRRDLSGVPVGRLRPARRCATSWPGSPAARSRVHRVETVRRVAVRDLARCSTTSPPTCTRATRRWPSGGPRR